MTEPRSHPFRDFLLAQALFSVFGLIGGTVYAFASGGDFLFCIALGVVVPSLMIAAMLAFTPVFEGRYLDTFPWLAGGVAWCGAVAFVYAATEPNSRGALIGALVGDDVALGYFLLFWWEAFPMALIIYALCFITIVVSWGIWVFLGKPQGH